MTVLASTIRYAALAIMAGGQLFQPATAAPFCLTSEALPPQCIYFDARDCQREAQHQGATCSTNEADFRLTPGVGQYCVITSSQVSICHYADRNSCTLDAQRHNGTCVDNPRIAPVGTPDPYSPVNGN